MKKCGVTTVFGSLTQEDQPGLNAITCLNKETNKTIRKQGRSQATLDVILSLWTGKHGSKIKTISH